MIDAVALLTRRNSLDLTVHTASSAALPRGWLTNGSAAGDGFSSLSLPDLTPVQRQPAPCSWIFDETMRKRVSCRDMLPNPILAPWTRTLARS